jgi:raffinose/stachyose/melibiose transport system permease protein
MATLEGLSTQGTTRAGATSAARWRRWRRRATPWLFILPAVLLHLFVIGGPALFTFFLSLTSWNGFTFGKFIGFENYHQVFTSDTTVGSAFLNNVKWTIIFLTIPIALGLGVALMIRSVRHSGLQMTYRTIFYLPATVSSAVVGRLWQWIYDPFYGINTQFTAWGWTGLAQSWLADPNLALYAVAVSDNWRWWGFLMIIFLAALHNVDPTLYEAARVDGAGGFRLFWHVTLPSLRPTLVFVGLLTIIWSFQVIDLIYIMTQGGPANASMTLSMWIYQQAIYNYSPGYASAIAVLMTVGLSGFIAGFVYLRYKGWDV